MKDINYNNYISNILAVILSITPIIVLPYPMTILGLKITTKDTFMLPKALFLYAVALLLVGILVHKRFFESNLNMNSKCLTDISIVVYACLLTLSTIFSVNPNQSLKGQTYYEEGLITVFIYTFLYLIAKRYYSYSREHLHLVMISAGIISVLGICQFFGFDLVLTGVTGQVYATFRNPNYFGAYLVLMTPIAIFTYINTSLKRYYIITGLLFFCLLASNTRGSWLGFIFSMIVLTYYIKKINYHPRRFINVIVMIVVITIAFNIYNNNKFANRFTSIIGDIKRVTTQTQNYERAGAGRIFIWKGTLQIIKENPLMGTGIETFSTVFNEKYYKESINKFGSPYYFFKAHNEYLNIAQSSGIPSLLVYLLWLATIIRSGIKIVPKKIAALPLLASIIGYSVQAFFNVSVVAVAFIFWCFCGILMNLFNADAGDKGTDKVSQPINKIVAN